LTQTGLKSAHSYTRSSLNLLGGALQVRTGGMPAQPSWCKSQTKEETTEETKRTSENSNSRRYFFDTLDIEPGYLAGLLNVLPSQPMQPNHHMIGFFNDIAIDPAFAGSICVPTNYFHKNPAHGRDFYCTKEKQLSGDHYA
jgi:hypothetical protein